MNKPSKFEFTQIKNLTESTHDTIKPNNTPDDSIDKINSYYKSYQIYKFQEIKNYKNKYDNRLYLSSKFRVNLLNSEDVCNDLANKNVLSLFGTVYYPNYKLIYR